MPELPTHSREAVEQELATLDFLNTEIEAAEKRLEAIMKVSVEADLLKTLPCVGTILSMVLMLEIGRVDRFPTAEHLASYAGLVPRVHSSGGHTHGAGLRERKSQPEMGVCRSGQSDRDQSETIGWDPCRSTVSPSQKGGRYHALSSTLG
jgi:hypothetical protein